MLIAQVAEVVQEHQTFLDAQTIAMLSGLVIPLITGFLSKINASAGLKAVINAVLSATAGVLATVTIVDSANVRDFVIVMGSTWIVSIASYYGVWKPTGVAGSVIAATSSFGLSSPPKVQTDDKGVEDAGDTHHV